MQNNKTMTLKTTFITWLSLIALLSSGLVGFIAYKAGQRAVEELAKEVQATRSARIIEFVQDYVEVPQLIGALGEVTLGEGHISVDAPEAMERLFQNLVSLFPSVSSIYFGNREGGLINSGRGPNDDSRHIIATDDYRAGTFRKYAIDDEGRRGEELEAVAGFDARNRAWYRDAVAKGGPIWSSIYPLFTGEDLAIAAARPIFFRENFVGVAAVDIFLGQISSFLRGLDLGTGAAFLVERSGLLVASSRGSLLIREGESFQRVAAIDSDDPLIRSAARSLLAHLGSFDAFSEDCTLQDLNGEERYFLKALPLSESHGIDWIIAIVVPERDLSLGVGPYQLTALLLAALILLLAIALAIALARRIVDPLLSLNEAAQEISRGDRGRIVAGGPFVETNNLAQAFNEMSEKLRTTMTGLQEEIARREIVEEALRREATTDMLTGLPNRRHFLERLESELERLRRYGRKGALIMVDIDRFKDVNDRYGHNAGDTTLRAFGGLLAGSLRKSDLAGRLGGEEFALFLPETDLAGALAFAERVRKKTENCRVETESATITFTISLGVTAVGSDDRDSEAPLIRADRALYRAKELGRNRTETAEEA